MVSMILKERDFVKARWQRNGAYLVRTHVNVATEITFVPKCEN